MSATEELGGSYEVIRRRLLDRAGELGRRAEQLDARRREVFGGSEMALVATERVRTENNCVPRDLVALGVTVADAEPPPGRETRRKVEGEESPEGAARRGRLALLFGGQG